MAGVPQKAEIPTAPPRNRIDAFLEWEQNKEALSQQYPSAKDFIKCQVGEGITSPHNLPCVDVSRR
ncbi:MAG: hypothetical protein AB1589_11320 [Cyanobacteriota bacterium]